MVPPLNGSSTTGYPGSGSGIPPGRSTDISKVTGKSIPLRNRGIVPPRRRRSTHGCAAEPFARGVLGDLGLAVWVNGYFLAYFEL